jgi:type VI secretion system protein ImpG
MRTGRRPARSPLFSKYYQDELEYLRLLGREFAEAYPQLAPMLADRGGDPDVERLLEGVAFLTARVREKLDDELPEAIHAIAELLFPQLLRPLPSAAILELTPMPNVLRGVHVVPAGTEYGSIPVDGTQCLFQSTSACELVPWSIEDVRLEPLPDGKQNLRIEFKTNGLPIAQLGTNRVRLHLTGEARSALGLLHAIHERLEGVAVSESLRMGTPEREVQLGRAAMRWVGFDDEDALLIVPKSAFVGFRLLAEYFALPTKFAFVDVVGIDAVAQLDPTLERFVVKLRLRGALPSSFRLTRDSFKLHCVPVVNTFQTTAEPIRLTSAREAFLVRPADLPPAHGGVYAVTDVHAITRKGGRKTRIPAFFDFAHVGAEGRREQVYYTVHHKPSVVGEGTDVSISLGTPENSGVLPDADVLSIDLLATNRKLAGALRAGEISVPTARSPAVATFRNLGAVTPHVPAPTGRDLLWRVVAHASMGLRSLAEPDVLRAALAVYNLPASVDRQAERAAELRLGALRDVRVGPAEQLYRGAVVRGVAIDIDVDEKGFDGEGDVFLFSAVLDRLFAEYVSLNSFARTTTHGVQSKLKIAWPPRIGNSTLL